MVEEAAANVSVEFGRGGGALDVSCEEGWRRGIMAVGAEFQQVKTKKKKKRNENKQIKTNTIR